MVLHLPITLNNLCRMADETSSKRTEALKQELVMKECRPSLLRVMALGLLLCLIGCRSDEKRRQPSRTGNWDPLLSGMPGPPPAAPSGTPSARKTDVDVLPLERDPGSTTSTAALASKGGRDNLRIGEGTSRVRISAPKDVWRDPEESGVKLKQPEPLKPVSLNPKPPTRNGGSFPRGITSRIASVEQGLIQLRRMGAVTDLKTLPDKRVRFIAVLRSPDNPGLRKRYESPPYDDELTAVRAVLARIERDELNAE